MKSCTDCGLREVAGSSAALHCPGALVAVVGSTCCCAAVCVFCSFCAGLSARDECLALVSLSRVSTSTAPVFTELNA